jgi:hypothetical protein
MRKCLQLPAAQRDAHLFARRRARRQATRPLERLACRLRRRQPAEREAQSEMRHRQLRIVAQRRVEGARRFNPREGMKLREALLIEGACFGG